MNRKSVIAVAMVFCLIMTCLPFISSDSGSHSAESTADTADTPLCFTATSEPTSIGYVISGGGTIDRDIRTSKDGITWSENSWDGSGINLKVNEKLYVENRKDTLNNETTYLHFVTSAGSVKISGNINSMINQINGLQEGKQDYCFRNLFMYDTEHKEGCNVENAYKLKLSVNPLVTGCYMQMFIGSPLTGAPNLPAASLAEGCYAGMFKDCTSLGSAPNLFAGHLPKDCYKEMFMGCTSLEDAPIMMTDENISSIEEGCCQNMFSNCELLEKAPVLPSTGLAKNCYKEMFMGCTSLNTMSGLPAESLAEGCYAGMFKGCTSLDSAPELPAESLTTDCYNEMFYGCTALKKIVCHAIPNSSCTVDWLCGVSETGKFYYVNDTWPVGQSGNPWGDGAVKVTEFIEANPAGGEGVCRNVAIYNNHLILDLQDPIQVGMHFFYWTLEMRGGGGAVTEKTHLEDGQKIYGFWEVGTEYVMYFNTDGGTHIDPIFTRWNHTPERPRDPTKKGYTFVEWDKDFPEKMPPRDITLNAIWIANTYEVIFNPNGGSVDPMKKYVTYDSEYGELPTPTRTGYIFDGWWTEASGGTQIKSDTVVKITATKALYAHWIPKNETITLEPGYDGGTVGTAIIIFDSTEFTSIDILTRDGYILLGYYDGDKKVVNADKTIVKNVDEWTDSNGKWKRDGTQKLTAKWAIEVEPEEEKIKPGEEIGFEIPPGLGVLSAVTVDNKKIEEGEYELRGQQHKLSDLSDSNQLELVLLPVFTKGLSSGKHVLVAQFEENVYAEFTVASSPGPVPPGPTPTYFEVSYDLNGGSEPGPGIMWLKEGSEAEVADYDGTKENCTFAGWLCNGKIYQCGEKITVNSDMAFTAIWLVETKIDEDIKTSGSSITFTISEAAEPLMVLVNDIELISGKDYKCEIPALSNGGSTIRIILLPEFTKTLPEGDCIFEAYFADGNTAYCDFEMKAPSPDNDNTAMIAGIAIGAIVVIALIGGAVYFLRRR